MSEWKKVKLGECCEITSSKRIFLSDYVPVGIPFYRSKEIAEMQKGESISDPLFISNDKYEEIKCKFGIPQKGDLLLTAIGATLGIPFVIKNNLPFYFKDGNLIWFKNFNDLLDSSFLYTWMCSSFGYQSMQNIAIGSAQKALTISALKDLSLIVPPIDIQHRIATILSRYDSLIENYQKQIKLLEEAAQRLYKEWFVNLHFPGHENTKIVDGVPEGWEKKKVGDITPIKTGKKDANFGTSDGAYPFFTCSQEPIKAPSYSFDTSAVILAGNGDFNVKLYRGKFEAYQRTYVLEPTNEKMLYLLYFCISENMNRLATGASGSTIKFLTKGMIESLVINEPSINVLNSFNHIIEPIRTQKENLQSQIRLLTEARDRLLPKLMSGEIKVS